MREEEAVLAPMMRLEVREELLGAIELRSEALRHELLSEWRLEVSEVREVRRTAVRRFRTTVSDEGVTRGIDASDMRE